jgi:hypothetical protein
MTAAAGTLLAGSAVPSRRWRAPPWRSVPAPARAETPAPRTAFRVCQDPNNLPFSDTKGQGFENKLAELFARELTCR